MIRWRVPVMVSLLGVLFLLPLMVGQEGGGCAPSSTEDLAQMVADDLKSDPDFIAAVKGPKGDTGDDGATGATGRPGPTGIPGKPGATGAPGQPGPTGIPGQPGPTGTPGEPGATGVPGEPGSQGAQGDQPAHEWNGTQLRFENPDDSWGDFVDLQGPAGPPGDYTDEQVAELVKGPLAEVLKGDADFVAATTGPQGAQGEPGPAGPQGDKGDKGDPGEPGPPGTTDHHQLVNSADGDDHSQYLKVARGSSDATYSGTLNILHSPGSVGITIDDGSEELGCFLKDDAGNDSFWVSSNEGYLVLTAVSEIQCRDQTDISQFVPIRARSFDSASSRKFKKDIIRLTQDDCAKWLSKIGELVPTTYLFRGEKSPKRRLGLIAEEVPTELRSKDGEGVDLYGLTTVLLASVKELKLQVDAQQAKIQELEQKLQEVKSSR